MSNHCHNRTCYEPKVPGRDYCERCYISWRKKDRRRYESHTWPQQLMRRFGLSVADYWKVFDEQGGRCRDCGQPPKKRKLGVLFDRTAQAVAGLYCERCLISHRGKAAA